MGIDNIIGWLALARHKRLICSEGGLARFSVNLIKSLIVLGCEHAGKKDNEYSEALRLAPQCVSHNRNMPFKQTFMISNVMNLQLSALYFNV